MFLTLKNNMVCMLFRYHRSPSARKSGKNGAHKVILVSRENRELFSRAVMFGLTRGLATPDACGLELAVRFAFNLVQIANSSVKLLFFVVRLFRGKTPCFPGFRLTTISARFCEHTWKDASARHLSHCR